jgi:hypothetical protein
MHWKPFVLGGQAYDLSHLHPRTCRYEQPAKDGKPARFYTVDIFFSLHCFTRGLFEDETVDDPLCYSDAREMRRFDFERYELSKQLPGIIEELGQRKCYHTGHDNFVSVALINANGQRVEYNVFFTASRSSRKRGVVNLYVQSAYVRDTAHSNRPRMNSPIRFYVILHNVLQNWPIRPAPK